MNIRHPRKNGVHKNGFEKKLRLETLEDRRMLAVMIVNDLGDGSLASLAGDGQLSLREAVEAINTGAPVDGIGSTSGQFGLSDAIVFDSGLFVGTPKTLALSAGQLELQSSVTLLGPSGNLLTIDAQLQSRIFDITATSGNFTISQMTLRGGVTNALSQSGGAIRSVTTDRLLLSGSKITTNVVAGGFSKGGGISASGRVEIVNSSIEDNFTVRLGGDGGGVFTTGDVIVINSSIAGNRTLGVFAIGGGINAGGTVTLHSSTVSGNQTLGDASSAAGILAVGNLEVIESTISGNETMGSDASGGGAISSGTITVTRSTIVNNRTLGANTTGGGILTAETDIIVSGSIIAKNSTGASHADIQPGTGTLTVGHSLIGDTTGLSIPAATNLLNQNPLLGPLTGGGLTPTHAPLSGSPVIDAGDPLVILPPVFDQRGAPFLRIADGDGNGSAVIDMGSYEVQAADFPSADFDGDSDIDGADFFAWQRGFNINSGATSSDGDADNDGDVDGQDLSTWKIQFGGVAPLSSEPVSSAPISSEPAPLQQPDATVADRASLIDLAIAVELSQAEESEPTDFSRQAAVAETAPREQAFATLAPTSAEQAASVDLLVEAKTSQDLTDADEGLVEELVEELVVAAM